MSKDVTARERSGRDRVVSALQKEIRRGKGVEAMIWADRLHALEPLTVWSRLRTISHEDVAQPWEVMVTEALHTQYESLRGEHDGERRMIVMCCAKVLAEGTKDRRADEILDVLPPMLKEKVDNCLVALGLSRQSNEAKKLIDDMVNKPESFLFMVPDYALDRHTIWGYQKGHGRHTQTGLDFWVHQSTKVDKPSPSYDKWRRAWETFWETILKKRE